MGVRFAVVAMLLAIVGVCAVFLHAGVALHAGRVKARRGGVGIVGVRALAMGVAGPVFMRVGLVAWRSGLLRGGSLSFAAATCSERDGEQSSDEKRKCVA